MNKKQEKCIGDNEAILINKRHDGDKRARGQRFAGQVMVGNDDRYIAFLQVCIASRGKVKLWK
ncbi:MAG: hypothetical protein ACI4RD_09580 [Kiritimatiellia bacterium]